MIFLDQQGGLRLQEKRWNKRDEMRITIDDWGAGSRAGVEFGLRQFKALPD
jgi:hypothetical protein